MSYRNLACPRCSTSLLLWDEDENCPWCAACGYRPRIAPLAEWYIKRDVKPTDQYWKQRQGKGVPPATRVYD